MVTIQRPEDDAFGAWVAQVVNGVVAIRSPAAVHVVEVDHWFDEKWLGFSGKTLGALGVWATDLTVPPFHPHRVRSEVRYSRRGVGEYVPVSPPPALHREQPSDNNLQRRLRAVAPDTACFWYPGDASSVGRGCLMAYLPLEAEPAGWYVGLKCADGQWLRTTLKGITTSELGLLEEKGRAG